MKRDLGKSLHRRCVVGAAGLWGLNAVATTVNRPFSRTGSGAILIGASDFSESRA